MRIYRILSPVTDKIFILHYSFTLFTRRTFYENSERGSFIPVDRWRDKPRSREINSGYAEKRVCTRLLKHLALNSRYLERSIPRISSATRSRNDWRHDWSSGQLASEFSEYRSIAS